MGCRQGVLDETEPMNRRARSPSSIIAARRVVKSLAAHYCPVCGDPGLIGQLRKYSIDRNQPWFLKIALPAKAVCYAAVRCQAHICRSSLFERIALSALELKEQPGG
jgi:hypothetical protein